MATITLTITKDGTDADPNSGDHATVVFDDGPQGEAGAFLESLSRVLWRYNWQTAFEVAKQREQDQDSEA